MFPPCRRPGARSAWLCRATLTANLAAASLCVSAGVPISEVLVTARGSAVEPDALEPAYLVPKAVLERADLRLAGQAVALLPGVHLQTNSRGEATPYVRGSGERQTMIFLDGAPINVPWDQRLDLGALPASLIGDIGMARGATSVKYGPNTIGGAITLVPRSAESAEHRLALTVQGGWHGMAHLDGSLALGDESASLLLGGSYLDDRGDVLSGRARLPFNQEGSARRSNTDRELTSMFARGAWRIASNHDLVAGFYHSSADKGVAAEGHIDPTQGNARFWRYPRQDMSLLIVKASGELRDDWTYSGSVWWQSYRQDIDRFANLSLERQIGRQEDRDRSLGGRASLAYDRDSHRLELFASALTADHWQRDFTEAGLAVGLPPARMAYRQEVLGAGAEYTYRLTDRLRARFGGSRDSFSTPRTGDKPGIGTLRENSYSTSLQVDVGAAWLFSLGLASKVRFPSMRELFGEDLGRFLPNDALKVESATLLDLSARWQAERVTLEVNPFANWTRDTIDQRRVLVDGVSLRQRYNLEGSTIYGVDVIAGFAPDEHWTLTATTTLMHIRPRGDAPGTQRRIPEKPATIARWDLAYTPNDRFTAAATVSYRGPAYSLDEDNTLRSLPDATALGLRVAYLLPWRSQDSARAMEVFARVDNLTDTLIVPQLGLPDPGRTIVLGVKLRR